MAWEPSITKQSFCSRFFLWPSRFAQNGVQRDRSSSEEDQCKRNGRKREGKFIAAFAEHTILPMHLPDRHSQVNQDEQRDKSGQESNNQEDTAGKLGKGRGIREPSRQSQARHTMDMLR